MKEEIVIVDQEDNIITHKDRYKLDFDDIYRVSALWLTNSDGDILLAQRSFDKKHDPGKWGPAVAGTVEKGENYRDNIVKEIEEEIGLKNLGITEGPKVLVRERYNHFTQWFIAILDRPAIQFEIQKDEVNCVKWFSRGEIKQKLIEDPDFFLSNFKNYFNLFE